MAAPRLSSAWIFPEPGPIACGSSSSARASSTQHISTFPLNNWNRLAKISRDGTVRSNDMKRLICVPVCTLALVFSAAQFSIAQDQNVPGARHTAASTPRLPDDAYLGANSGKPDLGGNSQSINSKMRGIWRVPYIIDMQKQGCALNDQKCYENLGRQHTTSVDVPFTELGRKAFEAAQATNSKEDPEGFCLPPGVPRMMYTPYPTEILQLPERIVFVYEGGAHVWRNIWLDGRQQPKDPNPTYLGYSTGKWEGETLV